MGVFIKRALLFGVDITAPAFWKLPYELRRLTKADVPFSRDR